NHKAEVLEEPTRREAVIEEESLEPDPKFLRQLEEQRLAHQKELLEAKQRRAEKNKEFEEELKEIREKQKQCTLDLLNCIILKQRFEEKKQEVADWIENCYKKPVVYLFKHFSNFETYAYDSKFFKNVSEDSTQEVLYLHKNVLILLDTLQNSFDQLTKLAEMNNDATFLKVLQRSICDRVKVLNQILDILEENEYRLEWYTRLTECFGNLNIAMIPTTEALQRLCSGTMSNEDLEFPVKEVKSTLIINEVDDSSDTSETPQIESVQKPKRKRNCESIIDEVQTDKSIKQSDPHLTVAFLLYHYREQFSEIFCK
uniref:Casc1_N domain-containing protein n=1 Tax=Caenorhabditis tropicalis TaxID=1561998 RepID=A0A1I7SYZ6_9PELO